MNIRLDRKRITSQWNLLDLADYNVRPYNLPQSAKVKRLHKLLVQENVQLGDFRLYFWLDE